MKKKIEKDSKQQELDKWYTLNGIFLLPFIILLIIAIKNVFTGFRFMMSSSIGIEAFFDTILIYGTFFSFIFVPALVLLIISAIKIFKLEKQK